MTRPNLINGDVRQVLSELEPESVQCVVTSPPYWGLRDYGSDGQLGLEATPEEYIDNMVAVFREVKRVLRKDGTVWLNIGDNYFGGGRGEDRKYKEAYDSVENSKPDWKKIKGLKPKDLIGIPWRLALALQADGWWLRNDIIWSKPNPMPEPVKDRLTKSHEYIFLLTKSKTYYYDHESIKEPYSESSIQRINQSTFDTQKGGSKDYGKVSVHDSNTNSIRGTLEKFKENLGSGRNRRTVWDVGKYGNAGTEAMYRQGMHRDRGKKLIVTRPDLPSQKEFVDFIRSKTNAKELSGKSGIKLSTVEHWFRYDESGFSFPNVEDWMIIKDFVKDEDMDKRLTNVKFHYDSIKSTNGRNRRTVWDISTKSYSGAHFATFPEEIPELCIKAGTSKAGCCASCGAPIERVVEKAGTVNQKWGKQNKVDASRNDAAEGSGLRTGDVNVYQTKGWKPSCECNAEKVPCIVLDPFAGSGTTCAVASRLGRDSIGIELNEEYLKLARKRCKIESESLLSYV